MSVRVELRQIEFRYGLSGAPVLKAVSLDVAAGSLLSILGPSGSGKSTVLSLIAGVETPQAGDIRFDDASVLAVDARRRGVAMVLQQPYLFPYLTVGQNVTFGLAARGVARRAQAVEAERWLELVGLGGMSARRPRELSGGEAQRVALVRALAIGPRVLLLDEPLASLDPAVRRTLQTTLRDIVSETGVTTVLVTHDLAEAMSLGDRTALLRDGRIVAEGTSGELFQRPPNRAAAELVGVTAFIDGEADDGAVITRGGRFAVQGLDVPAGTSVTLAIRPEHLRVAPETVGAIVTGRVQRCTFRGEHWDLVVHTPLGVLTARSEHEAAIGTACRIGLPAAHLVPVSAA